MMWQEPERKKDGTKLRLYDDSKIDVGWNGEGFKHKNVVS